MLSVQVCFSQYSSVDTTYYPNKQIHQIIMKLEGDSIIIKKRYYSQYIKFENNVFLLGEKKENRIEAIETYARRGKGLMQEGYSEYWHQNGNKKLEIIYSKKNGNRYINQWDIDSNQVLILGNGIYTQLDMGISGLDSLAYEVKDSLFQGKFIRYAKDRQGEFFVRSIQNFEKNKPIGTKVTYNAKGGIIMREKYFNNPDSILFEIFYLNGQIHEKGLNYKYMKFGVWKYYTKNEELEKEIEYRDGHYNGEYKEYYSNGNIKVEGNYVRIIEERKVNLIDIETYEETKSIQEIEISVKNGRWIYRDRMGEIEKIRLFEKGNLKKETNGY